MLDQIRSLQAELRMSEGQLLHMARWVSGTHIVSIEYLLDVERFELLAELQSAAKYHTKPLVMTAA